MMKQVMACDLCGKERKLEELTHGVLISLKAGGKPVEYKDVCGRCIARIDGIGKPRSKGKEKAKAPAEAKK